ncbi:Gp138 family membrane-puncturing spike protein, partial [Singulisphaera rosea]
MTTYAPPSRNPADNDTLTGVLKLAFTKFLQKTDDMLPARVIAYNRATNRAQVQPLISVVTTANQVVP